MALRYKLPKQAAAAIPLDATCSIQSVKQFIENENHITSAFKLRVYAGGTVHYLKPSQTLAEVAALGTGLIICVNFYDEATKKVARRQLARETAALVRTDVQDDGAKTREKLRWGVEDVKECIREEVKKISDGAHRVGSIKRPKSKLVGLKVVAAQFDDDMRDEVFEVCHAEDQTFPDGEKHTVCLIKAEGKPTLSRELSKLSAVPDPFAACGDRPVRVVVVESPRDHAARYHTGWRGIVAKAPVGPNAKVQFSYFPHTAGKVAHTTLAVPKSCLRVLEVHDVSMLPNKHPWLGRRVVMEEGAGEVVHVSVQGRVKIALDAVPNKKKQVVVVESRGASFEQLFTDASPAAAPPQAAPEQSTGAEPHMNDARTAIAVADSDAESDAPPELAAAPESEKEADDAKTKAKKKRVAKRKPAAAPRPPEPKRKRVGRVASPTGVDGVDVD